MLREFKDNAGVKWRVWDVRPAVPLIDRRLIMRRSGSVTESAASRRREADRRQALGAHMSEGWLAFDSVLGRRRLMQIPQGWTSATEAELCEFCQQAQEAESRLEWGRSTDF
jgi:hypothetical protein